MDDDDVNLNLSPARKSAPGPKVGRRAFASAASFGGHDEVSAGLRRDVVGGLELWEEGRSAAREANWRLGGRDGESQVRQEHQVRRVRNVRIMQSDWIKTSHVTSNRQSDWIKTSHMTSNRQSDWLKTSHMTSNRQSDWLKQVT